MLLKVGDDVVFGCENFGVFVIEIFGCVVEVFDVVGFDVLL